MTKPKSLAAVALTVLFLAACGSSGGGLGDILGGGNNTNNQNYELRGTVDYVDTNSRSIYLRNVSGYTSMLSSGGSNDSVRVYYDSQTAVQFGGQNYRPEDLERGDEVTVRVAESTNNSLMADVVTVTRDVSTGNNSGGGIYDSGNMVRGTVSYVDTSRRTIEVNRGAGGSNVIVEYGANTPVYFNGQTYRVADLERGDEIEVRVSNLGNNRFSASDITVLRSMSGSTSGSSSQMSTVRGTVSHLDTSRRTIEIESASWINRFNTGTGSGSNRMVISYDNNVSVDVAGRLHPVSGLERGDVIEVQVENTNSSVLRATRIFLVRDVNDRR